MKKNTSKKTERNNNGKTKPQKIMAMALAILMVAGMATTAISAIIGMFIG